MTVRWIAVLATLVGCYGPNFPEGRTCSAAGECPEGQMCAADNRCYSTNGGAIDGGDRIDGSSNIDAPGAQADARATVDARPGTPDASGIPDAGISLPDASGPLDCTTFGGDDWTMGSNGHCYVLYTTATDWFNAQANCQSFGGELMSITEQFENDIGGSLAQNRGRWLGARQTAGPWLWEDGSDFTLYENWQLGEPNGSGSCLRMGNQSGGAVQWWYDAPCGESNHYLCEYQ